MVKVSVIIPVYNTEEYLEKCLDSVINQTLSDIEIICINDCSTDNSLGILNKYAANDNRITVIDFKENKGAAAARNKGIETAKGKYLGFIDSDDFIDLEFYEKLYKKAVETNADVAIGNIVFRNGKNTEEFNKHTRNLIKQSKINFYSLYTTAIFKQELFINNNIRFSKHKTAEDYIVSILASYYSKNICFVDDIYYHYVKRNLSNTDDNNFSNLKNDYLDSFLNIFNIINSLNYSKSDYKTITNTLIAKILDKIAFHNLYRDKNVSTVFLHIISKVKNHKENLKPDLLKKIDFIKNGDILGIENFENKQKVFKSMDLKLNKIRNMTGANHKRLLELKDKHKGEQCFIIGGSPSLKMLDLTKLNNEYTFSVNWGFKLKEQGLKHATYHVMTDPATFKDDNATDFLPEDFCNTYLISSEIKFPKEKFDTIFFDFIYKDLGNTKLFETDITKPLAENRTVILIAMQLAYYMGFKKMYIIGVDLDFQNIKGHAYSETIGEKNRQKMFSTKFAQEMYTGIESATRILNGLGVEVYNASPVGNLNCMPRVDYISIFKEAKVC